MRQFTSASGFVTVKLTGADIPALLHRFSSAGVLLFHIQHKDELTVYLWLRRVDFGRIHVIAHNMGAEATVIQRKGIYWSLTSILRRPIIVFGITLILLLSWFVPTRIFFVSVQGNTTLPTKLILEKAAQCGVVFGASRRDVRSEKIKNSLLEALPQLQWTGINTYGCTAVISVTERTATDEPHTNNAVSSIVADRDGIVYSYTVTMGNPLCKEGQAVKAGQTLVSGYSDCGIKIQATRARAEVYAQTMRYLSVESPIDFFQKGEVYEVAEKYSLILGKKRINFSKDSGISHPTCDKMYLQYHCVLPGGFQLPIAIGVDRWFCRKAEPITEGTVDSQAYARGFAKEYLASQMISGKILEKTEHAHIRDGVYSLTGRYVCLEMIGREQSEEIIKHNGKTD